MTVGRASILIALGLVLGAVACRSDENERAPTVEDSVFVFVRVPEPLMPLDRAKKYEDPLDASLRGAGLGEVTGGGSQMGEPGPDGTRAVEWIGIDVEVTDVERGIPFIKSELVRLGAPAQTVLEFNRAGAKVEEHIR